VIDVTPEMAEWQVTLPAMKAGPKPHTLKVQFSINGEMVHERIVKGIVFGEVWCVVAPAAKFEMPKVEDSGQIVRMIENQSKRDGRPDPSRFSICTSRTPRVVGENGKASNRFASYWKDAQGLAAAFGHTLAAKSKQPVGIIFLQAKKDVPLKNWIAPEFLKDAPSLEPDYRTIGSKYPDNPYYLDNVRRYIRDWKGYWADYIPAMIKNQAVSEGAEWGDNWGQYPSPKADFGDTTATFEYNVYMHSFTPAALSGVVFLTGKGMVAGDEGANFGPEMAVLAKSVKSRFSLWQEDVDTPVFYTVPSKALAPKITQPSGINGSSTAVPVSDWSDLNATIQAVVK